MPVAAARATRPIKAKTPRTTPGASVAAKAAIVAAILAYANGTTTATETLLAIGAGVWAAFNRHDQAVQARRALRSLRQQ